MSDVFISYSRRDIAFARLIREVLQQSQIDTWIDWDRIPVGERWWQEITEAIQGANVFMLIISRNSLGSKVCRDEIGLALENHKRIVPILVDQLAPEEIAGLAPDLPQFNWVVFERDQIFRLEVDPGATSEKVEDREVALPKMPQFQEALRKLSVAIHTDWEWVKYHTQLQVEALRWDHNGRDASWVVRGTALEQAEQQLFRAAGRDPAPTSLQVEYVTASRQEEARRQQERLGLERKARRRQRYVLAAVAVGLVVSSALGVVAWGQRNQYLDEANARATAQAQTEQQRQAAVEQRDIAVSRQLAAQALTRLDTQDVGQSLLLSMEAYRHADTTDARGILLQSIQTEPHLRYFIGYHADSANVVFSPDGKTLATASDDGTIGLWKAATGESSHAALWSGAKYKNSLAFDPDGHYLASGGPDGEVLLWNVAGDYSSKVIFKADAQVVSLAFSPDGKSLAVGTDRKSVVVLSVAGGNPTCASINGTSSSSYYVAVAFSPDGKTLAVGDAGSSGEGAGGLSLWDPATCQMQGQEINTARLAGLPGSADLEAYVYSLAYRPDGTQIALAVGSSLVVVDTATRQAALPPAVISSDHYLDSVAYGPDGLQMALGVGDGSIVMMDSATGQRVGKPLIGQQGSTDSVAFSVDGHSLASGGSGWHTTVMVWDLQNQPLSRTLTGHSGAVDGVAFSPNSKILATAGEDQTIRLWDTGTWQQIGQSLAGHDGAVQALAFSPDSKVLASGGADQLVHLWNASTGQSLAAPLSGEGSAIKCVAFSPDGKWLAAGGADDRVAIWDAATNQLVAQTQFSTPSIYSGSVAAADIDVNKMINSLGFAPDSSTMYFSTGAGHTYFMPLSALAPGSIPATHDLRWSTGQINQIQSTMSPDGKLIALANTTAVELFDVATNKMVGLPMNDDGGVVHGLAFTPDGRLLASGSPQDKTIRLWDTSTGQPVGLPITGHSDWINQLTISSDGKWLASSSADGKVQVVDLSVPDWLSLGCGVVRRNMAIEEWEQYLPDEPYRPTCADQPADPDGPQQLTALARTIRTEGNDAEAMQIVADGLAWVTASTDSELNNTLCWTGSLDGFAAQVMPACERAVSLAPADWSATLRDSRGLARALTGDTSGAIEDFQAFVDWSKQNGEYDPDGKLREAWIEALKKGQNPFDQKTLDSLRT